MARTTPELAPYLQTRKPIQLKGFPFDKFNVQQPVYAWYWARTRDKASHDPIPIPLGYRGHMSIVGSSVPCERLFSIAGNIASEERNRLDPTRFDRLLFLKSLDIKHWEL
ncbi:hypothetical protein TNCV_5105281 [Trichonephila clavipes]|nr:hypothetical protein TNCV_5105281 [Trichonephila clavipes]